jgi:energy-coupling factor transport system substrate-specific component
MREAVAIWRNTRLVVLTAVSASLYAALLIPFKVLPLIPGVTELRPANAVPVVCSFLFGPAGAWGAAIGNLIGDFFGGIGPGDFFGFAGNFLYGFLPHAAWRALGAGDPLPRTARQWVAFVAVVALAAAACALVVGWGLNTLGFVPFAVLGNIVFFNNFIMAMALSPPLLLAIYPRVKQAGLRYEDLAVAVETPRSGAWRRLGLAAVVAGTVGGFVVGNLLSTGQIELAALASDPPGPRTAQVAVGVAPFVALIVLGVLLL